MLGNFSHLPSAADFFKINLFKTLFLEHYQSVKQFGSRSGPTIVGPDLCPNCFAKVSADDISPLLGCSDPCHCHVLNLSQCL